MIAAIYAHKSTGYGGHTVLKSEPRSVNPDAPVAQVDRAAVS